MLHFKKVYRLVSSMKAGLILLGLIGLVAAIGTAIRPQTFYHTTPFKILLVLLFINMGFCTFEQIYKFVKVLRKTKTPNRNRFWSKQFSLLILHFGIVLILIGGIVNAYSGQSAPVKVLEGETIAITDIISAKQAFALKVNQFTIDFYADGSPSQYISDITIIDEVKLENFSVSVNHPLNYRGIKAYQQSYGYMVDVINYDGENESHMLLDEGQIIGFQNTRRLVKFFKYIPNYDARYGMQTKTLRPDNPKIIYSVYEDEQLLGIGAADIAESIQIDEDVFLNFTSLVPYTVLLIKSDPGLLWAGIGSIMLMVGVSWFWYFTSRGKSRRKNKINGGTTDDIV